MPGIESSAGRAYGSARVFSGNMMDTGRRSSISKLRAPANSERPTFWLVKRCPILGGGNRFRGWRMIRTLEAQIGEHEISDAKRSPSRSKDTARTPTQLN